MLKRLADAVRLPGRDVRVPTRLQFQTTECGVAALAMILAHHGRHVSNEELRTVTGVSRDCVSAADMVRAARHYGLVAKAYTREPDTILDLPRPFLAHLRFIHFVVVEGFSATDVLVNDPGSGRGRIPREKFHEDFTGIVLTFQPGPDFVRQGNNVHPVVSLGRRLGHGSGQTVVVAVMVGLLAAVLLPIMATTLGALVDSLRHGSPVSPWWDSTGGTLAAALLVTAILRGYLLIAQQTFLSKLRDDIVVGQTQLLTHRLASLPASFFTYRLPGKLHEVLYSSEPIARLLSEDVLPGFLRLAAAPICLTALAWTAPAAALAVALVAVGWIVAVIAVFHFRGDVYQLQRNASDEQVGTLLFGRDELLHSKLGGRGDDFTISRLGGNAALQKALQESGEVDALVEAIRAALSAAAIGSILLLSARMVREGRASLGDAVNLLALTLAIIASLRGIATLRDAWDQLRHTLLPIDDLLASPPASPANAGAGAGADPPLPEDVALRATGLTFGYSPTRPPLLRDVDLTLARGEQLGLTGPSGGGKSTLASLLAGDCVPWSGRVEYLRFPPDAPGAAVAWVDKSSFFFDGSVRDNLCLWSPDMSEETLQRAVRDACLEDVIAARPGGLESMVLQRGHNFSGGERQRLEIARALLKEPRIVVLDEATDALDPTLEARIRANLRARGCSVILVSHRASTLQACDRVLRVAAGQIGPAAPAGTAESTHQAQEPPPGPPTTDARASTDSIVKDPLTLAMAIRRIAAILGAPPAPAGVADPVPGGDIAAISQHYGLRVRPVRFVVLDWWRRNHGPFLGFRRDSGAPVLVTSAGHRPRGIDPRTGEDVHLSLATDLQPGGYRFYRDETSSHAPVPAVLWRSARESPREFAQAAVLSLLVASALLTLPGFSFRLFAPHSAAGASVTSLLGLAVLAAAAGSIGHSRSIATLRATGKVELSVMAGAVQRLTRLSPAFLSRVSTDDLARGLSALQRLLARLRGEWLRQGLDASIVAAGLVALSWIDGRLGFGAALLAAASASASAWVARSGQTIEEAYERDRRTTSRFLFDILCGISRLRLLESSEVALDRWQAGRTANLKQGLSVRDLDAHLEVLRETYPWLGVAAMSLAVIALPIAPWTVPAVLLVLWATLEASLGMGAALANVLRTRMLTEQANLLATAPLEPADLAPAETESTIELRDVSYHYPGSSFPALHRTTVRIEPGEFVAITGPSGGGKSTLLRMITGFDTPASGAILLGGIAMRDTHWAAWRRSIGLVSQDEHVLSSSTLRRLIGGLTPCSVETVWRAAQVALLAEDIARMPMGLQTIVESGNISTGQEQRLLIARELLRQPKVLILDEATNAIPDTVQARLFENLRRLGITCILVTHRETAIEHMDRVLVMEHGDVVWSGSPGQLRGASRLLDILRAERQEGHL